MDEKSLAILEKISGLYAKYGIRSVTMDDVARELGISKKTLYGHFADKHDLVKKVVMHHLSTMDKEFINIGKQKLDAIETLLQITDMITRFITDFNPSLNFDLMKYYPEIWAILLEYKRDRVFNSVKENLIRGIKEGLYRKDMNPDVVARLYVSRMRGGMDPELMPMPQNTFSLFFKEVITYHIRGIASQKGLELFESISKKHKLFQQ
jgi:TetR/AcrR family transcriptional regulator, cholesterol catabolism regulator